MARGGTALKLKNRINSSNYGNKSQNECLRSLNMRILRLILYRKTMDFAAFCALLDELAVKHFKGASTEDAKVSYRFTFGL